ncbi:MAG: hypothetical protein K9M10_01965 [Candidatus Pacebacteria bacterium]|nr:hypothetical protein [Candidatus Paceibacterota bacterium]MCF7857230.1 hypothetical protein [Candidatus Paceibacterota bacterium]
MIYSLLKKIFISCVVIFSIPHAHIQAAPEYSVTPLVIDSIVESRDIIKKAITITNIGGEPVTIYPTVNNISRSEEGAIEEFLSPVESDRTQSLASWIEISRKGIDLPRGKVEVIDLTLRINPQAVPGTYHAFIGFGNGDNRNEAEKQVKNGQAPGTVVTVTIREKKVEFLKLSKFFINRFVTKADNEAALYSFKNPGDQVLTPTGEIIIYDGKGQEVASLTINDENVTIPPGGAYDFVSNVPTEGMFGKYKAFLTVEYGSSPRASLQDTSYFYVFPIKLILTILSIVILIVGAFAWYSHKRYFDSESIDDSEHLMVHVRGSLSEAKDHDIDLKKK